jgi:Xaa-Pro aminopeptidase
MPFLTRATFDYRRRLMTEMMRANGLDALAFTGADFFQWATNFHVDVQTWERPIVVVVPLDGTPFAIMNELSTNHLRGVAERGLMWVDDVTIYAEHPRLTNRVPVRAQWAEALADLLRQRGLARGRIGVEAAAGCCPTCGSSPVLTSCARCASSKAARNSKCIATPARFPTGARSATARTSGRAGVCRNSTSLLRR